ncbi:MAG: RidA family protein [Ignavibacteriales bacterium]
MFEEKIRELGIEIPESPKPLASYVPAVKSGNLIFTSGQLPIKNGKLLFTGKVGAEISEEDATKAAEFCAINCLSAAKTIIKNLDEIKRVVKVVAFVASNQNFNSQPKVANGASDLIVKIFGDYGKHSRSAVGVSELPLNSPVEVEMIFEV